MLFLYSISIYLYTGSIFIASLLSRKARMWRKGRRKIYDRIEGALAKDSPGEQAKIAWFHCASLGEFEQGRPVIEEFRSRFPSFRILLTFFSPSGYEVRKNYTGADWVFYLPADTGYNAERFITLVSPEMVFFIKYEYWFNYLKVLHRKRIPVYIVSAIFRPEQHFFRWYGKWFLDQIRNVTWFFLQDRDSAKLLSEEGISSFTVTGDTRFDRVWAVSLNPDYFPLVEKFCEDSEVILAGSTWPEDEDILFPVIWKSGPAKKFIIAPHEIHPERISSLISRIKLPALKYSEASMENILDFKVLILDSIGILANLYQYPDVVLIGGGFGAGIHNILEAAAFGKPIIFGPNYEKFREAKELISLGGAFSIQDTNSFLQVTNRLLNDPGEYSSSAETCRKYIRDNQGATEKIIEKIYG